MSKRCELQKEYYKEYGNYKGEGKYNNHYVHWLENRVLALTLTDVVSTFFCEDEDLKYSSKKCKEQCSGCKWIENL